MAMNISRQIKLRSVEQAIFQPSYNRLNFFIQPDGLSTDLSQSYLSMRLYLTNAITNTQISATSMRELIANNLVVSFGNNDKSYSPACLIRVARLFANKGNELLEEINFSNVLTQTVMNQLCNDFETLEASNLLTGSSTQIGHGSSFPASVSAFINNPTEVHIPLRDLFGVCRHSNFELAVTEGLQITLELEDKQSLFKVTSLGDFQEINVADVSGNTINSIKPQVFTNPAAPGYTQNCNSWASTPVAPGQFVAPSSNLFVDISGNTMIQHPKEGFFFSAEQYFVQPVAGVINSLTTLTAYTADQYTALGLVAGAFLKLKYAITSSTAGASSLSPIEFTYMATILTAVGNTITFAVADSLYYDAVVGRTVNNVVAFLGAELLAQEEVAVITLAVPASGIQTTLASNQLTISTADFTQLKALGLLDINGVPTGGTFDIGVQMFTAAPATATTGAHIMPDVILNELSPSIRQIFSNQLVKLPTQGSSARITNIGAVDGSGNRLITLTSLGCEGNTSIQPANIYPTGNVVNGQNFVAVPATAATVFIWNVQNLYRGPNGTLEANPIPFVFNNLSYQIDKFELVLLQSSINPQNRMSSPFIYSTFKLETATIETAQPTYARQFILEENVYNCMLLTPAWNQVGTDKGSLISTRRGVSYYRYSVNQVNQTNRDIYLSTFRSYYPSSLYLDRLNDTFNNSDYILRSPVGIKTVGQTAEPVLIYPLKIYKAVSETDYTMGQPGGATVQINLYADTAMNAKIQPGNIFMFKQLLKQL
jgi:hypothetical protein